jgi:hypothetical protein
VWVSAAFAAKALEPVERAVNRVTNWWRPLVACPHCNEAMTRRGHDMVPFQGCDEHGYWIDDENVGQTGLARRAFAPLLDAARKHARAFADELKHAELAEQERERFAEREREARRTALEQEERASAVATARAAKAKRDARELACQPYLDLVRTALDGGDALPLAERLMKLEQMVQDLHKIR